MQSGQNSMRLLNLTHANLKKDISINRDLLFAWYWSEAHKATHLISTNGGAIPVLESKEEVDRIFFSNQEPTKGETNDNTNDNTSNNG